MITDTLKVALANHIESALIVQGYHWNFEGVDFEQFHSFFGEIYVEYFDQVDRIAEYIRIVSEAKEYVNASVDIVKTNKTVKSNLIVGSKPVEMVAEIIKLNSSLTDNFKDLFKQSTEQNLEGLANYCADRIDILNKLKWKLIAITK
jgi:starvation-inducible DNA-binding protein